MGTPASAAKIMRMVSALLFCCLLATRPVLADDAPARTIVGYCDPLTARPGDTVEFMVSTIGGGRYQADLVRVVNGDNLSRYADQFEVREVKARFAKKYDGIEQALNLGSYVHVENPQALDALESFTVAAWIFPTFDPTEYEPPDLENIDPFSPPTLSVAESIAEQTVASRYDKTTGTGWALRLDEEFRLEFVVGESRVTLEEQIRDWDWAYVAAAYDATTGRAVVHLLERPYAPGDRFTARTLAAEGVLGEVTHAGPLRIAAVRDGAGAARADWEKPGDVFTGRIQDFRIAGRALTAEEIDTLSAETTPASLRGTVVADFDFARGIGSGRVSDVSGSRLQGVVVNPAERGVRGRFWDGSTIRWTDDPDQYDAITFYPDDLHDAEWKSDFSYEVPEDLASGIYAARIRRGDFVEYVPFFVAAPKGRPRADLAVWLSDYNYLAYSNISIVATAVKNYPGHWLNTADVDFYLDHLEYATGGVYNMHVDGRYYIYGSRLRPDLGMKPGGLVVYNFTADTHITAFLEHEGIEYDVITDELLDAEGPALLNQYRCVLSSTHPEYVPADLVDQVAEYTAQGGRFVYLGANGWFWSVGAHPAFPGVMESRNFSDIADRYLTNGVRGGLLVETGRHPGPVFGNEMAGMIFNGSSPYRKLDDADDPRAAWIFEGTGEGAVFGDYGLDKVHGGVAGFEIDRFNPDNGAPRHTLHLATSEPLKPKIEDVKLGQLPLTIAYHPSDGEPWARADLVFFETPNGGAMFSTGSITWISSTLENDFDNDVATITRNVIRRFLDPEPFPPVPVSAVDDVDRAPGNPEYEWTDQQ